MKSFISSFLFRRSFYPATLAFAGLLALTACAANKSAETAKSPKADSPSTAKPAKTPETDAWKDLFDGETLTGWKEADFSGRGKVSIKDGKINLGMGVMTGITWTNPVIKMNYEIELKAMRTEGGDFFCGLTFPVNNDPCSLIVGGWGGGVVGLSSLDGEDAANNETTKYMTFENNRWYTIRLRVLPKKIMAWIDDKEIVNVDTTDRRISIRIEVEESKPLGIATWSTAAALKDIKIRKL